MSQNSKRIIHLNKSFISSKLLTEISPIDSFTINKSVISTNFLIERSRNTASSTICQFYWCRVFEKAHPSSECSNFRALNSQLTEIRSWWEGWVDHSKRTSEPLKSSSHSPLLLFRRGIGAIPPSYCILHTAAIHLFSALRHTSPEPNHPTSSLPWIRESHFQFHEPFSMHGLFLAGIAELFRLQP